MYHFIYQPPQIQEETKPVGRRTGRGMEQNKYGQWVYDHTFGLVPDWDTPKTEEDTDESTMP